MIDLPQADATTSRARKDVLVVNEIFGPTIQGEGARIGRPTQFLRLWGCHVQCEWCDTPYSWKDARTEARTMAIEQVARTLDEKYTASRIPNLVITGGEPMTQAQALLELTRALPRYTGIEIETSGVIEPLSGLLVDYNVSPKLAHARARVRYSIDVLHTYARVGARFKFVVQQRSDFDELDTIVERASIDPQMVWVMPLGISRHDITVRAADLVDDVIARRYNLTTRLHILLWGDKRGV